MTFRSVYAISKDFIEMSINVESLVASLTMFNVAIFDPGLDTVYVLAYKDC